MMVIAAKQKDFGNWKVIEKRSFGGNFSVIWKKGHITIQLFRDSMWGKTRNMNVIVSDDRLNSIESTLGRSILIKHAGTESEALTFAKNYMRSH